MHPNQLPSDAAGLGHTLGRTFEKPAKEHLTGSFSADHIVGFRAKVLLGYFSEPEIFWGKVQGYTSHGEGGIIFSPFSLQR